MRPLSEADPGFIEAMGRFRKKMGRPKAETTKVHIGFRLAADIVESVKASGPGYNTRVEQALRKAGFGAAKKLAADARAGTAAKPAVPPEKSITSHYIICLEDGRKLKSLKRHLRTEHNLSPEEYREKWGLPSDYPMVAPAYSKDRSALAKQMGLGQQRRKSA